MWIQHCQGNFFEDLRSLSTLEVSYSTFKPKQKENQSQCLDLCNAVDSGSRLHYPFQCKDIFRGLAKLKALEAMKGNCITTSDT